MYGVLKFDGPSTAGGQSLAASGVINQNAYDNSFGFGDFFTGHGLTDGILVAPRDGDYRFHFTTRFYPSTGDEERVVISLQKNGVIIPSLSYRCNTPFVAGACSPSTLVQVQRGGTGNGNPTANVALAAAPTPGNLQVVFTQWDTPASNSITGVQQRGTPDDNFQKVATDVLVAPTQQNFRLGAYVRFAKPGDTANIRFFTTGSGGRKAYAYAEYTNVNQYANPAVLGTDYAKVEITANNPTPFNFGPITPPSGFPGLLVACACPANNVNDTWSGVPNGSLIEDLDYGAVGSQLYIWVGHDTSTNFSGSYSASLNPTHGGITRGYGSWFLAFECNQPSTSPDPNVVEAYGIVPNVTAGDQFQLFAGLTGGVGETWRILGTEFGMDLMQGVR